MVQIQKIRSKIVFWDCFVHFKTGLWTELSFKKYKKWTSSFKCFYVDMMRVTLKMIYLSKHVYNIVYVYK